MPNETKIAKRQREWEEIEDDRKRQKSSSTYDPENYANRNSFTHGYHFETASNPVIGEGECKTVRKGTYDGDRGECVGKALKDGLEGGSLGDDVKAAEKSLAYLAGFHKHIAENLPQLAGQVSIKMNVPEVWMYCHGRDKGRMRKLLPNISVGKSRNQILAEPFLPEFTKFNSNSGATNNNVETAVAQALSHFSYHLSGGAEVLCDLQGGKSGANTYILSDVAINSKKQEYGAADLGEKGVETFLSNHKCSMFCGRNWRQWKGAKTHFVPVMGTTAGKKRGIASNPGEEILEPSSIMFSQNSISAMFQNPAHTLQKTAAEIASQKIAKRHIPVMRIVKHNGVWRALDNRRLAVFRMLAMCHKISYVRCTVCEMQEVRGEFQRKFDDGCGESIRIRGSGYPEKRVGLTVSDTTAGDILEVIKKAKVAPSQMSDAALVTMLMTLKDE